MIKYTLILALTIISTNYAQGVNEKQKFSCDEINSLISNNEEDKMLFESLKKVCNSFENLEANQKIEVSVSEIETSNEKKHEFSIEIQGMGDPIIEKSGRGDLNLGVNFRPSEYTEISVNTFSGVESNIVEVDDKNIREQDYNIGGNFTSDFYFGGETPKYSVFLNFSLLRDTSKELADDTSVVIGLGRVLIGNNYINDYIAKASLATGAKATRKIDTDTDEYFNREFYPVATSRLWLKLPIITNENAPINQISAKLNGGTTHSLLKKNDYQIESNLGIDLSFHNGFALTLSYEMDYDNTNEEDKLSGKGKLVLRKSFKF